MARVPAGVVSVKPKQGQGGFRGARHNVHGAVTRAVLQSSRWRKPGQQPAAPSALSNSRLTLQQIKEAMSLFAIVEHKATTGGR